MQGNKTVAELIALLTNVDNWLAWSKEHGGTLQHAAKDAQGLIEATYSEAGVTKKANWSYTVDTSFSPVTLTFTDHLQQMEPVTYIFVSQGNQISALRSQGGKPTSDYSPWPRCLFL